MKKISIELRVGAAVIAAALILFFGVMWIEDYSVDLKSYNCSVIFPNIGNLSKGDQVRVLGVKKGEVTGIELRGNSVLVSCDLKEDVVLRSDALFTVRNLGLMGERFVEIEPGSAGDILDLSAPAAGFYDTGISEVMGMMGHIIIEIDKLVSLFESALITSENESSLKNIIDNMEKTSNDMRELTENNKQKMNKAVNDFAEVSARLKSFMDENEGDLENIVENIDKSAESLVASSGKIDSISTAVRDLVTRLQEGEGTIGKVINDEMLYQKLLKATMNIDSLVTDLKENPKKYFHFSVF